MFLASSPQMRDPLNSRASFPSWQLLSSWTWASPPWSNCYIVLIYLLPLYFGTQRTLGGRPLMLKCFPSKTAHCSSRKSFFCFEHGSVLQDLNFIRRPTQYFPPFLGLEKKRDGISIQLQMITLINKTQRSHTTHPFFLKPRLVLWSFHFFPFFKALPQSWLHQTYW